MALPTAIAVNQTAGDILIDDLGLTVPASSQITLTDFVDFWEISGSQDLEAEVAAGNVLINDGTSTLTLAESQAFLDITGNLNGPTAATAANQIAVFSDTTGRYVENSNAVLSGGNLTLSGNILPNSSSTYDIGSSSNGWQYIFLSEDATAPTTAAGIGAIYVKNDIPSTLHYVDDAGTDFQLATELTQNNTIYVSKAGNDSNSGRVVDKPKLTIGSAITAAAALTPSSSNRIQILIQDAGIYAENITLGDYVSLIGPAATVDGSAVAITPGQESIIKLKRVEGDNNAIRTTSSTALTFWIDIEEIEGKSASLPAVSATSGAHVIYLNAKDVRNTAGGDAISVTITSGSISVVADTLLITGSAAHCFRTQGGDAKIDCRLASFDATTGIGFSIQNSGDAFIRADEVTDGTSTSGIGISIADGAKVLAYVGKLDANTTYATNSTGEINLFVGEMTGTSTGTGTENVTEAGGAGGAAGIGGSTGATDNAILRADGTGGSTLQSSGITIDDSDVMTFPANGQITLNPTGGQVNFNGTAFIGSGGVNDIALESDDIFINNTTPTTYATFNGGLRRLQLAGSAAGSTALEVTTGRIEIPDGSFLQWGGGLNWITNGPTSEMILNSRGNGTGTTGHITFRVGQSSNEVEIFDDGTLFLPDGPLRFRNQSTPFTSTAFNTFLYMNDNLVHGDSLTLLDENGNSVSIPGSHRISVLHENQLGVTSGSPEVRQGTLIYVGGQPSSGDTFSLTDGTTTRTYGAGTGGDVQYTIGTDTTETMENIASAITGDGSGLWDAIFVATIPRQTAGGVVIYRANQSSQSYTDRIYATWTTSSNLRYYDFGNSPDYRKGASTSEDATVPSSDPASKTFGPGLNSTWLSAGDIFPTIFGSTTGLYELERGFGTSQWNQIASSGILQGSTGSTDNALLRANGTGGSTVQASNVTLTDSDNMLGLAATGFVEQASAPVTPGAGNGAIWVEDTAPNRPMYTDDDGDDEQIVVGRSLKPSSDVTLADNTTWQTVMTFTVPANIQYGFMLNLVYNVNAGDDIDLRLTVTSTVTSLISSTASSTSFSNGTTISANTSGSSEISSFAGTILGGASGGSITLEAKKQTDVGADGTVFEESNWLVYRTLV